MVKLVEVMQGYVIAFIVCFCYHCNSQSNESCKETLNEKYGPVIFVNLLYRHGERTILQSYAKDPHNESALWNIGLGQLTKAGEKRHYKLGIWIRSRYPDLVGEKYSKDDIYVLSSNADRCLMSAQCNLAGMYPLRGIDLPPFQPIPIHTLPREMDNMLYMEAPCERYELEKKNLKTSDYMQSIDKKFIPLYKNLSELTGQQISTIDNVGYLYDTLKIESEDMKLKIPKWTNDFFPDILKNISLEASKSHTHTDTMKRLKAGPLLTDILGHLVLKANGTLVPDRKMWIYSGHDETIVALLRALNLHDQQIGLPPYASLVAVELRKKEQQHFVTMLYKDGMKDEAVELRLNECKDKPCTLEEFLQLAKNMTVLNWKDECAVSSAKFDFTNDIKIGTPEVLAVAILFLFAMFILRCCCKRRTVTHYHKLQNQLE